MAAYVDPWLERERPAFAGQFEDVRRVSPPALRHRVLLNFEAESRSVSADAVIRQILQSVPEGG